MINLKSFEDFLFESHEKKLNIENRENFYKFLLNRTSVENDNGAYCLVIDDVQFAQRLEELKMKVWCIYFDNSITISKPNYQYVEVIPDNEEEKISDDTKTRIKEIFDTWKINDTIDYIYNISLKIKYPFTFRVIADLNFFIFNYPYKEGETVYTKGKSRYYSFDESDVAWQFDKLLNTTRHLHISKVDLFPNNTDTSYKKFRFPDKTDRQLSIVFTERGEHLNNIDSTDGATGVKESGVMSLINLPEIKKGNMCKHIVIVLPNRICCDALEKMIREAPMSDFPNLKKYMIVKAASRLDGGTIPKD